ncbi:TPA: peptidase, partial [Streptococcus pyogenes]
KTKQNKTKQNKTKQNKTKQNKTKQSLLCRYGLTSAATLLLTFGGASAVRADAQGELIQKLAEGLDSIDKISIPDDNVGSDDVKKLLAYLKERDKAEDNWRTELLQGIQKHAFDGKDGRDGETGPAGPRGLTGPTGPVGPAGPVGPV